MLCLVPLGSPLPASPRPSSVCSYPSNLASTSISVHNSCFPPFSVFSPGILLYLSLCLSILKHLGKLANSKKKKQKKQLLLTSVYIAPIMFQKGHRIYFYHFHLHSDPVIGRIPCVHQIPFPLSPGTTCPNIPCYQVKSQD